MKKVMQFSERDLRQLIWEELDRTGENEDLAPLDIQFVMNSTGQVSALVRGFVDEVEEISSDVLSKDDVAILEDVVFLIFRKDDVRKDGATLDELVEAVVREFEAQGKDYPSSDIQAEVERYLATLENDGALTVFKAKGDDRWKFKPLKGKELKVPSTGILAADVLRERVKRAKELPTFSFDLIKQMTEKAVVRRGAAGEVLDIAEVTANLLLDETPTEFSPDHHQFHKFVSKLEPSVKMALQQLAEDDVVELEPMEEGDDLEYWRKKQKSKKRGTAADILHGSGGVLDRSEALGEAVAEESPSPRGGNGGRKRQGAPSQRRPKKRKKDDGGTPPRGGFPFGFGSGTPFNL